MLKTVDTNKPKYNRTSVKTISKKRKDQKVYAFIDSQNVNLSVQDKGWKLDWTAFRKYLAEKFNVLKAFLFIGYMPGNETLYSTLQQQGYILIFKPLVEAGDHGVKGNVDAELVLRAMLEYRNYDSAVIVTGDGDFHALVDHLESTGKLKALIVPNKEKYSSLLKKFELKIDSISSHRKKLEYTHRSSRQPKKNPRKSG
ncbi:MAG: NYN domain-containing protein [Candidatus Dojkabacteria bacterium]